MKLVACSSAAGGIPAGRWSSLFSIWPSSPTSTASAVLGESGTMLICASVGSRLGTMTTPAAAERSDRMAVVASSACSIGPGRASRRSIAARSSAVGSATCIIPSTNNRRPSSVGIRPALVCGAANRPRDSRSARTERIEAGERLTPLSAASALDPTGSPLVR